MRLVRTVFFVFLALATVPPLRAVDPSKHISQYSHTVWLRKDGFFSGIPRVITQTTDGYLWIGTTEGLWHFDGVRFVSWAPPDGEKLPSPRINSLLASRDGSLWIGTSVGLSRWKNGHLTNIAGPPGVVPSIVQARDGTIWFVLYVSNGELCQVAGAGMRCYGPAQGVTADNYNPMLQGRDGSLWVGGHAGLLQWSPQNHRTFNTFASNPKEEAPHVNALQNGPDGSLWAALSGTGRGHGLQQFKQGVWKSVAFPGFDGGSIDVGRLFLDRNNALWAGSFTQGIYRIVGDTAEHFNSQDGLSGDLVLNLFEDCEGDLWVATANGIDKFRDWAVTSYSAREGLRNQEVDAILAASDNSVWIGGADGLDVLDHGQIKSIVKGKGLPGDSITSLFEDSTGRKWIGVDDTLTVYRNDRFERINRRDGTPMGMVTGIAEDADHDIWVETIGSNRALIRIRNLVEQQEFLPPSTAPGRKLATDSQGAVWRALRYGDIERRWRGNVHTYHYPHDPDTRVEQITVNPDGSVLGASPPGLIGWKDGKQLTMTLRNGLPCDTVYSFVYDDHVTSGSTCAAESHGFQKRISANGGIRRSLSCMPGFSTRWTGRSQTWFRSRVARQSRQMAAYGLRPASRSR